MEDLRSDYHNHNNNNNDDDDDDNENCDKVSLWKQ